MARAKQTEVEGTAEMFEQKRVAAVEKWARDADSYRSGINALKVHLDNCEFKLSEQMHANADKVVRQDVNGMPSLVYRRGDYNVVTKFGKERVHYEVSGKSKPEPAQPPEPVDDDEGADA